MGQLMFANGPLICEVDDIPIFLPDEEPNETYVSSFGPVEASFTCNDTVILDSALFKKLLGVREQKKPARPVRKRLLDRLKNRYGWFRTKDYTLTPCGDGKFSCRMDAGVLEIALQ